MTEQWLVQDCTHARGDIEIVVGDDFKIYIPLMATDWDHNKRSRMRAKAHLIAAAPDLLAALDNFVADYDAIRAGSVANVARVVDMALPSFRAAIAKATA